MEFTLRFTLTNPDLDTTKSIQHLHDNIEAAKKGALPPDVFEEAKRRLAEAGSMPAP